MAQQTKYEVLLEFIDDLTEVLEKVNANSAKKGDYIKLKEYFTMVGLKESTVDSVYLNCGFNDHTDFLQQRQLSERNQMGNVSCTISKINGLKEAVVEFLQCEIIKDMKRCWVKMKAYSHNAK